MTDPTREQLIGYLLGALDDDEREDLESQLNSDPELRKELLRLDWSLAPLDQVQSNFEVPSDLVRRTCELVQFHAQQPAAILHRKESVGRAEEVESNSDGFVPLGDLQKSDQGVRFRWVDLIAAAAVAATAALLIIPAVHSRKIQSGVVLCQNNLRQLGVAMAHYSQKHNGYFPPVPGRGKLAAAGIYAPVLLENGFLTDPSYVVCPASILAENRGYKVPTFAQLANARSSAELSRLRKTMGGSYGYCMGYMQEGQYRTTKNLRRPNFALMSDMPNGVRPDLQSVNHGGDGQNVLFEDGHVRFVTSSQTNVGSDDFFTNDDGLVAAGRHKDDSVIAASDTPPSPPLLID